jgi:hypothetical protein
MNLKLADRIVNEAIYRSWAWVVGNARDFGLSRDEMVAFWRRNDHMTPNNRCPFPLAAGKAGLAPPDELARPVRAVAGSGR